MAIDRKSIRIQIGDILDRHCARCKIKTEFYRTHAHGVTSGLDKYCAKECTVGKKLVEFGNIINTPKVKEEKRMNAIDIEAETAEVEGEAEVKKEPTLTKKLLEAELATGKSASQVERELGMKPGTIGYYMKKWGLKSQYKPAFKPREKKEEAANPNVPREAPLNDPINPSHYKGGKVECIDALEAATEGLSGIEALCTGNAIKYLWRWKRKGGIEDLKKARWYLDRLIGEKDQGGENDAS